MVYESPQDKLPPRISDLQARSRRRRRKIIIIIVCSLTISLGVLLWWLVIPSDILRFHQIEVEGNSRLTDQEVISLLESEIIAPSFWRRTLGRNHFLSWPGGLDQTTVGKLGNIRRAEFVPDYLEQRLKITIEERQFFGILCARKNPLPQCVWFDKEGFFFEDAFFPEGYLVLHIDDYSRESVALDGFLFTAERLEPALSALRVIQSLDRPVASWTVEETLPEILVAELANGPKIYFNLSFPADYAPQVIQSLIEQQGLSNLEYIDLRIQGRVFYKQRGALSG